MQFSMAEPHRLDQMAEVESARMFLWQWLLARQQGHLSHLVLVTGLRAIEALRFIPSDLGGLTYGQTVGWARCLEPWLGCLLDVRNYMQQNDVGGKWMDRVQTLHGKYLALHMTMASKPTPDMLSHHTPKTEVVPEVIPCDNAPVPAADVSSVQTCSPAEHTGSPCRPISETGFGTATATGRGVGLLGKDSGESKKPSSQRHKKKGTGHPKRGTPYTRSKKR